MANVTIGSSQVISSTTVTKPSGVVNGSVLVVRYHWFCAGDQHLNFPTMSDSFVDIDSTSFYNSAVSYSFGVSYFRKVITNAGAEPSTYTITPVTGRDLDAGMIVRLVNCDTTTPEVDAGSNNIAFGGGVAWSTGAAVDSLAEALLLIGVTAWTATVATPGGMTQDYLQDGAGDVAGFSENPGSLTNATRTANTGGNDGSSTAFVVFRASTGGGASPFEGLTDPNPTRARTGVDARGFTDASEFWLLKDSQFRGPGQFTAYDWPNPRGPRRSVDLLTATSNDLTSRLPVGAVAAPFVPKDWPNPRGRMASRVGFESFYVVDDNAPFAQTGWTNPIRPRARAQDWTNGLNLSLTSPPGVPFSQKDWPNPLRPVVRRQEWAFALSDALVVPPGVPFAQREWPNPIRAVVRRQDWTLSVGEMRMPHGAPFEQTEWPNPVLARRRAQDWTSPINLALFVPPVPMPFSQASWPVPPGALPRIALRGFAQGSAFWMLRDAFPFKGLAPTVPYGPEYPIDLRGSVQHALTTVPTPPVITFRPAWAVNSNRAVEL